MSSRKTLASALRLPVLALCLFTAGSGLSAQQLRFDRLSLEEGLSQSTITAVLQDRHGFIWLATQDGLNRYDGYDVVVHKHDPEDPETLSHNWISGVRQDRRGRFWLFPQAGGAVDLFDPDTGRTRRFAHDAADPASLSPDLHAPGAFYEDAEGQVWLAGPRASATTS